MFEHSGRFTNNTIVIIVQTDTKSWKLCWNPLWSWAL